MIRRATQGMLWSVFLAVAGYAVAAHAETASSLEYRVKAVFLLNFAKFTQWPSEAFESDRSPIVICILGEDPFGAVMEETIKGETVDGRKLKIKRCKQPAEVAGCQILFLTGMNQDRMVQVLRTMEGSSVLTVGESGTFLEAGGVIAFVMEQNKVRFAINETASERAGVKISSKLLSLAATVQTRRDTASGNQ